jgi:hypothetical protein
MAGASLVPPARGVRDVGAFDYNFVAGILSRLELHFCFYANQFWQASISQSRFYFPAPACVRARTV